MRECFFVKKVENGFFVNKVDLSSTQGALCAVSVFFILHFTYLGGPPRTGLPYERYGETHCRNFKIQNITNSHIYTKYLLCLLKQLGFLALPSGNVNGNINEVTLRRARLLQGWVTPSVVYPPTGSRHKEGRWTLLTLLHGVLRSLSCNALPITQAMTLKQWRKPDKNSFKSDKQRSMPEPKYC